ncbi:MAG: hypothetical protein IJR85_02745 [Synergistaceae bacterium]|nr:hypothetical protein [Synergistaceae bacterium]
MSTRKYVFSVTLVMYAFMAVNLVLWYGLTREVFGMKDMNRMGGTKTPEALTGNVSYTKHHTELAEYIASGRHESFDVLTLGDSFSNGKNNYQDYLVNRYGLRVINVRIKYHCLEDLYMLLNAGIVDEISPRVVILESVERSVQGRLGMESKFSQDTDRKTIINVLLNQADKSPKISTASAGIFEPVLVKWNITFLFNRLYRFLHPEQLSPEVYITKLDRPFFTNPGHENTLMHYWEDLEYLKNPLNAEMVNQNLNNAARLLKAKGIKLIFFAAADKYDLYYPYLTDKKGRPENPFFKEMREVQGKEYVFVDAMSVLREALARGEQDVYWMGDTHWSWKGIKIVCDEMVKHIIP